MKQAAWTQRLKGRFVVFDGPDGSGKSTQFRRFSALCRDGGIEVTEVREPGGTAIGERIREVLLDPAQRIEPVSELYLFLAARADLVARVVAPALAAGRTVIADRFQLSTEAYQCGGRGLDRALVLAANRAATGGLQPDLTLVLDLPPELGFERIRQAGQGLDRIERAGRDFHARVGAVFRNATGPGVVHLDATLPPEQVLRSAWEAGIAAGVGAGGATAG